MVISYSPFLLQLDIYIINQVSVIDVEVSSFGHYIDQELINLVDQCKNDKLYINGFSFAIF